MQPNRLQHETSPYLKQHANNPVDWYPWGPEALALAKKLDRPIFLSVGYSACHWCHVMEHESFEDPEIGALLNANVVSIKVDREERPDIDQIYMAATQIMTRQGGWPMSCFLTPDLKPFYCGTYFPPKDLYGRPSFRRVVEAIMEAWTNRREQIVAQAGELAADVQTSMLLEPGAGELNDKTLRNAAQQIRRRFDPQYGGFGQAPKFPHPMEIRLLLRVSHRFGDDDALGMARTTLDKMARGGIYDQLGGGFHRYSTDAKWLVPHFEKMLYDNALLTPAYVEAFQATGDPFYRQIVEETLGYILREMTSPLGPFFSTQDADSEGVEGKFFVWSEAEIRTVLGDDGDFFCGVMDVSHEGNWEESNILNRSRPDEQEAKMLGMPLDAFQEKLRQCSAKLLAVRGKRIWPGRDEKILTSWNGLMIAAFAQAYQVLENPEYRDAAVRAADYVLQTLRTPEGRLQRTTFGAEPAKLNGYLEDYAYFIDALVSLYEATFEVRWLKEALALAEVMIEQFWDAEGHGFFYTGKDHETLIARGKDPHDNATPSGNGMAVTALLRLSHLTGRSDLRAKAEETLHLFRGLLSTQSSAVAQMVIALDFHLGPVTELVFIGNGDAEAGRAAVRKIRQGFQPHTVVAFQEKGDAEAVQTIPLFADRPAQKAVTLYRCQGQTCEPPIAM